MPSTDLSILISNGKDNVKLVIFQFRRFETLNIKLSLSVQPSITILSIEVA